MSRSPAVGIAVVLGILVAPTAALGLAGEAVPGWLGSTVGLLTLPTAALVAVAMTPAGTGGRLRRLGLLHPRGWWRSIALGVVAGFGVLAAASFVVAPLIDMWLGRWLDPAMFDPLRGQVGALIVNVVVISLLHAAVCEELVFRGFLLQRIEHALGGGPAALAVAIVIQAALFGLAHYPQGVPGVLSTAIGGALWAGVFLWSRRDLRIVVVGHAVMNATVFVLVFLGRHRLLLG